jgi:hypothetical protein
MFDDLDHLRKDPRLYQLLRCYAEGGAAECEAWQDRIMQMPNVPSDALAKLHGRLLACEWLEQNTGATPVLQRGAVLCCYRITLAGQRALKKVQVLQDPEDRAEVPAHGLGADLA